jgi:tRNA (cmo5U34)-methyltransferase
MAIPRLLSLVSWQPSDSRSFQRKSSDFGLRTFLIGRSLSMSKNPCGDNLFFEEGQWQFNEKVSRVFPIHARKSIPGYQNVHDIVSSIVQLSSTNHENLRILDIGCSIGELEGKIINKVKSNFTLYAVDSSDSMIQSCESMIRDDRVRFVYADAREYLRFFIKNNCSLDIIISLYTLQFLSEQDQYYLLKMISHALSPGGIFILADKFITRNDELNSIMRGNYEKFKIQQGFTQEEINGKSSALSGVQHCIPYPSDFLSKYFYKSEILDSNLSFTCSIFYKR